MPDEQRSGISIEFDGYSIAVALVVVALILNGNCGGKAWVEMKVLEQQLQTEAE